MKLVRRQRQCLAGTLGALIVTAVVWTAWLHPSAVRYASFLPSFPSPVGSKSFFELGRTSWLIVEQRELSAAMLGTTAPVVDRRYRVNAQGAVEATALLTVAVLGCRVGGGWLVRRTHLRGRCDECGYDLRHLTSAACPECGARR